MRSKGWTIIFLYILYVEWFMEYKQNIILLVDTFFRIALSLFLPVLRLFFYFFLLNSTMHSKIYQTDRNERLQHINNSEKMKWNGIGDKATDKVEENVKKKTAECAKTSRWRYI